MNLLKINVQSFGKLKDFELEPQEGLNFYCHPNEFGKSTLIAFLYFIFYGYESKWMKNYFPWDGGPLSGSVIFLLEGKRWQIYRHHPVKGAEKQQVICLDSGEELVLASREKAGGRLLKLDGETFLRTFCVRQGELLFGRTDGLDTALKNLAATGDENASFQQAKEFLQKEHSRYLYRGRLQGPLADLKNQLLAHKDALFSMKKEIEKQIEEKERLDILEQERKAAEEQRQFLEEQLEQAKRNDAARLLAQWKELTAQEAEQGSCSPAADDLLLEQEQGFLELDRAEKDRKAAAETRELTQKAYQGETERVQSLFLPAETQHRLDQLEKGTGVPVLLGVLALLLAAGAAILGFAANVLFWIAVPIFMGTGIYLLMKKQISERQLCRACGVLGKEQLSERLQQYQNACERVKNLQEQLEQKEQTCRQKEAEIEQIRARVQALIEQTRLMNLQEVQQERFARAVSAKTADRLQEQKGRLLGDLSPEELEQRAKGGDPMGEGYSAVFAQLEACNAKRETLFAELSSKDLRQLSSLWEQAAAMEETIRREEQQVAQWSENLAAVRRSLEWLEQANEDMNRHFAPQLCTKAGEYLSLITGGKYADIQMDDQYEIRIVSAEGSYPVGHFSAGTKDAVYFSARLAVGELLGQVPLPLFLDDPFTNMDSSRQKRVEKMLKEASKRRQILYFSCRENEEFA